MRKVGLLCAFFLFSVTLFGQSAGWKKYRTAEYSINYPSTWEVSYENNQLLIVMTSKNDNDFLPSLNIISSSLDATFSKTITEYSVQQLKAEGLQMGKYEIIPFNIGGYSGHAWCAPVDMDGYAAFCLQGIIKVSRTRCYLITMLVDYEKMEEQVKIITKMLSSFTVF